MGRLPGVVPWFGGKSKAVGKLLSKIPETAEIYVEPFGGAASLLFNRPPAKVEVYNDVDNRLFNLMKVLQDPAKFERFATKLQFTNYSLEEFRHAVEMIHSQPPTTEEAAYAFFVAQNQGFGGWVPRFEGNWGRAFTTSRGMASSVSAWLSRLDKLTQWHDRISRCQIDSREAIEVIKYWDHPNALFYCDPPYVLETRKYENEGGHSYAFEPDQEYHANLVQTLLNCEGAVALSCYDHEVYAPLTLAGWDKWQWETSSSAAGRKRGSKFRGKGSATEHAPRTETLIRNPKCVELKEIEDNQSEGR